MNPSTSISIANEFNGFWQPFTRVFQALCISHYSIFRPNLRYNRMKSFSFLGYFLVFSAFHISIVVLTTSKGLQNMPEHVELKHKESQLMYYVNSLTVIGSSITHIITHLETLFNGKYEEEIYEKFKIISNIFATKLNHMTDFKARRFNYIQQTIGIFIFATFLAAASSFTPLPELYYEKYFMQPNLIFAILIIRARWCYISLFLNTISDTLNDLQILLKQQQIKSCQYSSDQPEHKFEREKIRYFREIYSNVWFIITLMSNCFGWSLISFLVEFTFEVISASYWLYINVNYYEYTYLNIR